MVPSLRSALLLLATVSLTQTWIVDRHVIFRRQTIVNSNAQTDGQADNVETDASAYHYKNTDGVVGMNVSSAGNATGANQSAIQNIASGQVGNTSINAQGNVNAQGQDTNSYSGISAAIDGDNKTVSTFQQGKGSGVGDTQANSNGNALMTQNGVESPFSSNNTVAQAGASGSLGSQSEVIASQKLKWDSLLTSLVGSAVAQGITNAQANVDLGAGNQQNGVEVNGLVSGVNTEQGNVNAQVNGNANMNNSNHDLTGNMYGSVSGTGNSTLVGASSLLSNSTTTNNTQLNAFGDSKVSSNGNNSIDFRSETGLNNNNGGNAQVLMNATDHGSTKDMTVQNGVQVVDTNGQTMGIGNGQIHGNGTENSNASITVDTTYQSNGDTRVIANGDGQAISTDHNNSSLSIGANANVSNSNGVQNTGQALATGSSSGENSNVTGNSFLNVDGTGSNGNAMMQANAGGAGNSSAATDTGLILHEGNDVRNASVHGSVSASGDKTQVESQSVVTDYAGQQSLSNYQSATSWSKGSSSASASNSGVLKRKRRSILYNLY